jgi:hypothetical protein
MNKTRIVAKDSRMVYSILADAKLEERTMLAGLHVESGEWFVDPIGIWTKFNPYLEIVEYNESMDVPDEVIEEMNKKQKELNKMSPPVEA